MVTTPPAARMLVLVPDGDLPMVELAQRIWKLAAAAGSAVLLIGLAARPDLEPRTRRALALLQTHTRFDPVPVSTRVARSADWVAAVRVLRRPGDTVVCFASQQVPAGMFGWRWRPLSQALEAELKMPAYVVTDVALPVERHAGRLRRAAWLVLSLGLVAAFFVLQAWIVQAAAGATGSVLLPLSVIAEFTLIGLCQRWRLRE